MSFFDSIQVSLDMLVSASVLSLPKNKQKETNEIILAMQKYVYVPETKQKEGKGVINDTPNTVNI